MYGESKRLRRKKGLDHANDLGACILGDYSRINDVRKRPNRTTYYFYSASGVSIPVSQAAMFQTPVLVMLMRACKEVDPYADYHHLFFPDTRTELLRRLVTFLHTGILVGNQCDQMVLCNMLVVDFGYDLETLKLKQVYFDSDEYETLNSCGINSQFCSLCKTEGIPLSQIHGHVTDHLQSNLDAWTNLGANDAHIDYYCYFPHCEFATSFQDNIRNHFQEHLNDLAASLKLKYNYSVKDPCPLGQQGMGMEISHVTSSAFVKNEALSSEAHQTAAVAAVEPSRRPAETDSGGGGGDQFPGHEPVTTTDTTNSSRQSNEGVKGGGTTIHPPPIDCFSSSSPDEPPSETPAPPSNLMIYDEVSSDEDLPSDPE